MYQKFDVIDVFNNSSVIYMLKPNSKIVSWISILVATLVTLFLISILYKYEEFNIYFAKVINNDEENYISIAVDEEFIDLKNRNYLEINDDIYKCHLISMTDNFYIYNDSKYWDALYECNLPDELNVNNNVLKVKVDKNTTTIFEKIIEKIRRGINNGRTK